MPRRIVLLSDGTGNSVAQVWRTNVWRTFERINLENSNQIAFYDDGVGTSSFKPLALLGGAFGYGLKRNVLALYKFACRNYRHGDDEIYLFGFSRGAFTARVVTGLILEQGLVNASSEEELDQKARSAYRDFRRKFHTIWHIEAPFRWLRDLFVGGDYNKEDNRQNPTIRFIGLWDTVAAYGMPVEEMARGIGQWLFPWHFPNCVLDPRVKRACHALSIDDDRTTFHPVLWDERDEEPLRPRADGKRYLEDERISQVWFPGAHANVGGGYPEDSIAQISLVWIMTEARKCGLDFKAAVEASPQTHKYSITAQDKDGRIYDPRSGFGGYYRYGPRDILALSRDLLSRKGGTGLPRIHESALKRIQNYAHSYAPSGIPGEYEIVTESCEVVNPQQNSFETPEFAAARLNFQGRIWNLIWLRRLVYFLTIAVSLQLIIFPLAQNLPLAAELSNPIRWVSEVVRFVGRFLPAAAEPWLDGYARSPADFLAAAIALGGLMYLGSLISSHIESELGATWRQSFQKQLNNPGLPNDAIYKIRTSPAYVGIFNLLKNWVAPFASAILFAYLGFAAVNHFLFIVQDNAGFVCNAEIQPKIVKDEDGEEVKRVDFRHMLAPGEVMLGSGTSIRPTDKQKENYFFSLGASLPIFTTSEQCKSLRVWAERGRKYLVTLESTTSFFDDTIKASHGFTSTQPDSIFQQAKMIAAAPLRRIWTERWFRIVVRIGDTGSEEFYLAPDKSDRYLINVPITASHDGELFIYVNDAVLGIPWLYDYFYRNNRGSTRVLVLRRGD